MNLLRTDLQTALQNLHVGAQESADNLRDLAEFIGDDEVSQLFSRLADARDDLADGLANAIRDAGDLPAAPNSEKEAGEHLIHRIRALFSADQTVSLIRQCLEAEEHLHQVLTECDALNPGAPYPHWRKTVSDHLDHSRTQLEACLKKHRR
ncbi:FUSC family protein [Marinimicrobium sp. C6131]|uniref:hypothetical protein n=1 Tax=Marinimicrobium sp. C6131 TaxID=3022676 RepID=UPI00223CBAFC|nr:hypothetical protein [Marinimicrobium sp. C6131]UZJ44026.1 FUSC family protein [Marinimicrobium sp. C6131]